MQVSKTSLVSSRSGSDSVQGGTTLLHSLGFFTITINYFVVHIRIHTTMTDRMPDDVPSAADPSSAEAPPVKPTPPSPPPSRQRIVLSFAVVVLVGLAVFALALEGTAIARVSDRLRRQWGHDENSTASDRVAARQFHNANDNAGALPTHTESALNSDSDEQWMWHTEVPAAELLHLSLQQAACLDHHESVIPWTFGRPGAYQESTVHNKARLVTQDDPKLLEKLSVCPDVDIYLPGPLRGHGYCEDAIVYSKCACEPFGSESPHTHCPCSDSKC